MTKTNILLAVLALGSCNSRSALDNIPEPTMEERMELAEINIRRAAKASSQAADRFERIEARVERLEGRAR